MSWVRCRSCATWYDGNQFTYCYVCGTSSPTDPDPPPAPAARVVRTRRPAAPEVEIEAARDGKVSGVIFVISVALATWRMIDFLHHLDKYSSPTFAGVAFYILLMVAGLSGMVLAFSRRPTLPKDEVSFTNMGLSCTSGCGIVVMVLFAAWFCVCVSIG